MKYGLIAALMMAGIIAVQMVLTYLFSFHVGEVFSKTAVAALFFYSVLRAGRKTRRAA